MNYESMVAGPSFLAIRRISSRHCARGAKRCAKCKEAEESAPPPICLVRMYLLPSGAAAPVLFSERDGKRVMCEYETEREFESEEEARAFASENGVDDVEL